MVAVGIMVVLMGACTAGPGAPGPQGEPGKTLNWATRRRRPALGSTRTAPTMPFQRTERPRRGILMRKEAVVGAVLLLAGSIATADTHSVGIGFVAAVPDVNLGGTFSFYNLVTILGLEGSVYGWQETQDDDDTRYQVGASLGINVEVLDNLYPSIGATVTGAQTKRTVLRRQEERCPVYHGETHCSIGPQTEIEHEVTRWGIEAKATYVLLDGWLGLTAGYRMTFDDPLGHQALFGASVVLQSSPSAYAKGAENGP